MQAVAFILRRVSEYVKTEYLSLQLPNSSKAYIQTTQITGYLLSENHKDGKSKAKFFRALGFNETNVKRLEKELLRIAKQQPVVDVINSPYEIKYVIVGAIEAPLDKIVNVLTVWIIDKGKDAPRFVTARPYQNRP